MPVMTSGGKVIGYTRVSTQEQGEHGVGLDAQEAAIRAEVERRGWVLDRIERDVSSGGSIRKRPGLAAARSSCRRGEADGIIVAKLDRLTRSLLDFAAIITEAQEQDYEVVVLDQGFDLATPNGRAMAGMLAVFAQWERELISQRTRDALAVKRSQGVVLGRPPVVSEEVRGRILELREQGESLSAIARTLNEEGVPGGHGGKWWPATVGRVSASSRMREVAG